MLMLLASLGSKPGSGMWRDPPSTSGDIDNDNNHNTDDDKNDNNHNDDDSNDPAEDFIDKDHRHH